MTEHAIKVGEQFEYLLGKEYPDGSASFEYKLGKENCYEITVGTIEGENRLKYVYIVECYNPIETHIVMADQVAIAHKRKMN